MLFKDIPFVVYETLKDPPPKPKETPAPQVPVAEETPQFSAPRGITIDSTRNYYIADTGNSRIQKFTADGKFLQAFGTRGEGEGELREPQGIAVDTSGSVYVTDALNHKLIKFTSDGAFVKEWHGPDTGFYGPRDLAFGPDGRLYIVDQGRTRVAIFDPATESFSAWGKAGAGDGQFNDPCGIAVGGGFVFVTDTGNGRIQVFDMKGAFIRQWPVPQWGADVKYFTDALYDDVSKRLYVSSGKSNEVLTFDIEGRPINDIPLFKDARFVYPSSMAISEAGNLRRLFVLNTVGGNLSIFDLEAKRR
jgi:DNA-binding beta-propeller fold protein YncE